MKVSIEKIYSVKCNNFRIFENPKISCVFDKILFLSIISSKCVDNNNRIFKEEKTIETLKIIGLIE